IAYWLKSQDFMQWQDDQARGINIQNLRASQLKNIQLPLPPLDDQKRIAAILSKADRLRRLRHYTRELSDGYLQSVFLEMFGDPVSNPKAFPVARFGEVCDTRLGKMLDTKQQTGKNKRPYLRNENVQWRRIDISDIHEMDFDEREREILRLRKGDILICEGGEVGRAAIWNDELPECYYQKALHRARPDPKLAVPEFILWLMWCLAKLGGLGDFTSQVTIAHLTGVKLKTIEFPLPPLPLQQKFAQIDQKYEQLSAQQRESERQAEHLFQSLLHRAFRGEV
ncbi:MAG: restriction endonuclease subunit S, partial [Nitrospira sp.]|nr:restriction endonuclease subunit S [Nitrospira sp.]